MVFNIRRKFPVITKFGATKTFIIPDNNWEYESAPGTWSPCASQSLLPTSFELGITLMEKITVTGISNMTSFFNANDMIVSSDFPLPVPTYVAFGLQVGIIGGGPII